MPSSDPGGLRSYACGDTYADKGEYDRAIADFKKVLELSQDPQLRQMAEEQLKTLEAK